MFENWYGGQETGAAMAALIFGTVDPSGKLPVTFPASLSQVPAQTTAQWPGTSTGVTYSEGVDIGYRWYQSQNITPAFPFGYGLSYTKFSFSNLNVGAFNANGKATVTATVTNTGSKAGADVAQMYVGDPAASQDPPEQLAGFQRVTLNPGQSATVTFPLTIHDLASWSAGRQRLGGTGRHLLDLGRRLLGQPAADRLDQPGPRADRPGRRGRLGRGRLAGQHGGQRERHPELGRAGRGDRRRGQPLRLQQPQGRGGVLRHAGGGLQLVRRPSPSPPPGCRPASPSPRTGRSPVPAARSGPTP